MNKLIGRSKLFLKRNSSTILTCVGAAGVVATTVMAVKATPKALALIEQAKEEKDENLTKTEIIKVAGPVYIPTVLVGAGTIACIFGANILNKRQQAALTSAYVLLENSYKEYRDKVKELYGEDADMDIRKGIAEDNYKNSNIILSGQKELFYDVFSERYFESTMTDVLQAEANINKQVALNSGAYLNEFYEFLGIPPIPAGQELGWSNPILESMYWTNWIDFYHSKEVMPDGTEYCMITMFQEPVIDFAYY